MRLQRLRDLRERQQLNASSPVSGPADRNSAATLSHDRNSAVHSPRSIHIQAAASPGPVYAKSVAKVSSAAQTDPEPPQPHDEKGKHGMESGSSTPCPPPSSDDPQSNLLAVAPASSASPPPSALSVSSGPEHGHGLTHQRGSTVGAEDDDHHADPVEAEGGGTIWSV
jgi:hypothetical protein